MKIDRQVRINLINLVLKEGYTVKDASEELGLKFSTSKSIVKMYREDGKLFKNEMLTPEPQQ